MKIKFRAKRIDNVFIFIAKNLMFKSPSHPSRYYLFGKRVTAVELDNKWHVVYGKENSYKAVEIIRGYIDRI